MDKFEMYVEIRGMLNQKYSISTIARKLNISRNTVYNYIRKSPEEMAEWTASTMTRSKKLDIHKELILHWLREFPDLTAAQVQDWLKEKYPEFKVGESTVRSYVRCLREDFQIPKESSTRDYQAVPDPPMGEQIQADFGFKTVKNRFGKPVKLVFIVFVLAHSRYKYVEYQNRPFTTKDVISAHRNAFKELGGVSKEILYDQDRLIVVSENEGDILLTEEFQQFVNEIKFEVKLCRKADPESKGKVENAVKFIKNNFINNRIFHNIDSWNEQSQKWLKRTGNGKIHNGTKRRPADVFLLEKQHMRQVNSLNHIHKASITRSVRKDNTILYLSNRYSVPLGTFQKYPEVLYYVTDDNKLVIYVQESGEILATHCISPDKGKLIQNRSHQRDRSKGIKELIEVVSEHFTNKSQATKYLNELRNRYPRYIRDQLSLIKKCIELGSLEVIDEALALCMERQLFSANDFQDVVSLFKRQRQVNSTNDSDQQIDTNYNDIAELTLTDTEANQRPLEDYYTIMESTK
ncbi:IS21 family transposase [Neobacillus sp. C211]|uniref:IS21 family transposase n=1 Tax=unclassified Neobacillus TaxID=2675272 RepID=UPI0039791871